MTQREELKQRIETLLEQRLDNQHLGGYEHSGCYGRIAEDIVAEEIVGLLEQPWHKFDPSDETTWPKEKCQVWIATDAVQPVFLEKWVPGVDPLGIWQHTSHWMPIPIPSPPPTEGE